MVVCVAIGMAVGQGAVEFLPFDGLDVTVDKGRVDGVVMTRHGAPAVVVGRRGEVIGHIAVVEIAGQHELPVRDGIAAHGAPAGRVGVAVHAGTAILGVGKEGRPGRRHGHGHANGRIAAAVIPAYAIAARHGRGRAAIRLRVADIVLQIVVPALADVAAPPAGTQVVLKVIGVQR